MRSVRLCFMCLAIYVLSFFGLPDSAFAAPIDLLENQNEMMGSITDTNLFENVTGIPRYSNTYWEYVSTYDESGSTNGTESTSGNEAAHTITSSVSVPSYKITTAAHTAELQISMYGYTSTGYDDGGNYYWTFTDRRYGTAGALAPQIEYPSIQNTVAAHTETGSLSVPKVTISSSGTFSAQDTRAGVMGPMAFRFKLNGFTSAANTDVYAVMSFAGISKGSMDVGVSVNEGDIIKPVVRPKPVRIDNSYTNRWQHAVRYYGYWDGEYRQLTVESDGTIRMPHDTSYFIMVIKLNSLSIPSGSQYLYVTKPSLLLYNDFGLDKLSQEVGEQTEQQTETLMSTDGSNGIVDAVTSQGVQIQNKLGFIAQTAQISTQLYDAITYEGEGYVTFPQLAWQGTVIIPETQVPILGWLPEIEDDVKTGCTLVLFLAWLHGIHSLYARIFLGQIETISEED